VLLRGFTTRAIGIVLTVVVYNIALIAGLVEIRKVSETSTRLPVRNGCGAEEKFEKLDSIKMHRISIISSLQ
jgi:hypothetical protein